MMRWRAQPAAVFLSLLLLAAAAQAQDGREAVLTRAVQLQSAGQFGDAADLLRPWVGQHPGDAEAALLLGQIQVDDGRAKAGVQTWDALLTAHRGSGPMYRAVIDRLRRAGLKEAAIQVMERAHRELEDPRPYAWDLAEMLLEEGEYERALDALLAYLEREPQRLGLIEGRLLTVAKAERAAGRGGQGADGVPTPGARTTGLLRALTRAASSARPAGGGEVDSRLTTHALLGSIALEAGQAGRALEAYAAIAPLPEAGPLVFQFASRCTAAGEHETAAAAYALLGESGDQSPYRFQALLRQAEAEASAGQPGRAAALFSQLADTFPERPEALEALFRVGQLQLDGEGGPLAARAAFEQVLALDRSGRLRLSVLQSLAECDLRTGDLDRARERYVALLGAGGEARPAAHFGLAEVALYQGRFDAVLAHGDSLLALHPAHPLANDALAMQLLVDEFGSRPEALARYGRALLLERQGLGEAAVEEWEWLTEYGPDGLRARCLLRWAQYPGRPHFSLTLFDRVQATWPDTPFALQARLGRAGLRERQGDLSEALAEYEGALLAFPESARAPQMRLEIQRLRRLAGAEGDG